MSALKVLAEGKGKRVIECLKLHAVMHEVIEQKSADGIVVESCIDEAKA